MLAKNEVGEQPADVARGPAALLLAQMTGRPQPSSGTEDGDVALAVQRSLDREDSAGGGGLGGQDSSAAGTPKKEKSSMFKRVASVGKKLTGSKKSSGAKGDVVGDKLASASVARAATAEQRVKDLEAKLAALSAAGVTERHDEASEAMKRVRELEQKLEAQVREREEAQAEAGATPRGSFHCHLPTLSL